MTVVSVVEECEVREFLIHLKQTAPGPDGLPNWFWRDYAYHLASNIFNSSFKQQVVPSARKLENVSPIPKESTLSSCNQFRPISLTNIIMRLFERFVCKKKKRTVYFRKDINWL